MIPVLPILFILTALALIVFLWSYTKNRSRLINGFLFFVLMMFAGTSLLLFADTYQVSWLTVILLIALVLFFLTLSLSGIILVVLSLSSAFFLLKREGRTFANLLSLLLGVGIIVWFFVNSWLATFAPASNIFTHAPLENFLWYFRLTINTILFYLAFTFMNYILSSIIYRIYLPRKKQDYIIVLGSGLIAGHIVPPLLAGRIDKAIKLYWRQAKTTKPPKIIMSGGQGSDEQLPESHAMRLYALEKGVPETDILVEDKSVNTYQNMLFSKQIIETREQDLKKVHVIFTTTNYHVFRASMFAGRVGLKAQGVGSKTKFYFWYNAMLREFIAILMMNKRFHLIFLGVLLVLVVLLPLIGNELLQLIEIPDQAMKMTTLINLVTNI